MMQSFKHGGRHAGRRLAILAVAAALLGITSVNAQLPLRPAVQVIGRICIERVGVIPKLPPERVPVGCEVIDCCPGCPGPGPLRWRVRVAGEDATGIALRFENLPPDAARGIKAGAGATFKDGEFHIARGEAILEGVPNGLREPVRASYRVVPDAAALDRRKTPAALQSAAPSGAADRGPGATITIDQLLGPIIIREFRGLVVFERCELSGGGGSSQDQIRLTGTSGSPQAAILLDGRRTACVSDEVHRTTQQADVANVLTNGTCASETAVFAIGNAAQLVENVTVWTDQPTDRLTVPMSAPLQAPVTVWILQPPFATTQAQATTDLTRANTIYNGMHGGVSFNATVNDATNDPDAAGLLDGDCGIAANLRTNIGFTAGRPNVYYINTAGTARGWWCGNNTIIVSSTTSDNETLSHEFGHAFSLDHSNGVTGIAAANVMMGGNTNRSSFTTGQMFRVNFNQGSMLNVNGVRTGSTRNCPDGTSSAACPGLAFDVTPK